MNATRRRAGFFSACLLGCAPLAGATEPAPALETIVVTASRTGQWLKDMSAETTVLPRGTIETMRPRYADELLYNALPDVNIQGDSAANTDTRKVILRGVGDQNRTLVLLDGVPIQAAGTAWVDWHLVNMETVDRVEVLRGPFSSLYGSNAMGGVINLVTRTPTKPRETEITLSRGNFETKEALGYQAGKFEKFSYALAGRAYKTNGSINAPNPSRYSSFTSRTETNFFGKFTLTPNPDSSVTLAAINARDRLNQGRVYDNDDRQDFLTYLSYEQRLGAANLRGQAYLENLYEWIQFDNPAPSGGRPGYSYLNAYRPRNQVGVGGGLQGTFPAAAGRLTAGLDGKINRLDETIVYVTAPPPAGAVPNATLRAVGQQDYLAPFLDYEFKSPADRLVAHFGGRWDYTRSHNGSFADSQAAAQSFDARGFHALSPRGGVTWHLDDSTTLRASGGRAFNAPQITSLYVKNIRNITILPNPDLGPEKIWSYELGADRKLLPGLSGSVNYYQSWAADFVARSPVPGVKTYKWFNVGAIDINGVDANLRYQAGPGLALDAGYSFLRSRIRKNDAAPETIGLDNTYSPRNRAVLGATFDEPRLAKLTGNLRYTDHAFADVNHYLLARSYWTLDLAVARTFAKRFTARVEVRNAADNRYDVFDLASAVLLAPGRVITGSLSAAF